MTHVPDIGQRVPSLERTITLTDMVAYAGATWDWHRSHYDTAYTEAKGLPAPMVDGQMYGALFVQMLQDWLGPRCFVRTLSFDFRTPMFAGEVIRCRGAVVATAENSTGLSVTVDLVAEVPGQNGTADRVVAAPAWAEVLVGQPDGPAA